MLGVADKFASRAPERSRVVRFGVAVICVVIAAALRWLLNPLFGNTDPWIFFYPAVVAAAWYGRVGTGLLAAALSIAISVLLWLKHPISSAGAIESATSVAVFAGATTFITLLIELRHRAAAAERQARVDLEAERAFLNSVFSSITDGLFVLDEEWRFRYANAVGARIARRSRDELAGRVVWELFPQLVGTKLHEELLACRRETRPVGFEMSWPEGDLWLEFRAYPMPRGTGVYVTDISDRKRTERELANAQQQLAAHATNLEGVVRERTVRLEETVAELERFSYSISHDLRAPLRSIQSFAAFLAQDYGALLDATGRDFLQRIQNAAIRMDALITDVLLYSRTARGDIQLTPVDLDSLLDAVISQYVSHAADCILVRHPLGRVIGNETLLTQAVSNLLVNAVKFVRKDERPRIEIWTEPRGSNRRLCLRDSGIGIAESAQGKLFGLFQRAHSGDYEGTGIGLAIVKRAVERMNGDVGFESKVNEGSLFWIQLPAA